MARGLLLCLGTLQGCFRLGEAYLGRLQLRVLLR
jgi:hypothetical protein